MPLNVTETEAVYHFGMGDIFIGCTASERDGKPNGLAFMVGNVGEIGREAPELVGKRTNETPCRLRFVFHNVAGLDVLIDQAVELRKQMINEGPNRFLDDTRPEGS